MRGMNNPSPVLTEPYVDRETGYRLACRRVNDNDE